jgi:cytochrome b561
MSFAEVLGYFGLAFVLLASSNGLKKFVKVPWMRKVIGYHYLYGAIAFLILLTHFIVNLSNNQTNVFGFFALILLAVTVSLGGLFKQKKDKKFYKFHRILAQVMVLAVFVHVIVMWIS